MREVPCILCGSGDYTVRYKATIDMDTPINVDGMRCTSGDYCKHARIIQCTKCGHIYTSPRWTVNELITAYTNVEDDTYVKEEDGRTRTFRRRCRELEQVTGAPSGRSLLDLGAYTGIFVNEAINAGWRAKGIELSRWCVDVARDRGFPVSCETLEDVVSRGDKFDVVTLWDVIEHMDDPVHEIRMMHDILHPDGFLVIHTINIESMCARIMRKRWPWLIGMHLNFFSKKSLCSLLERERFTVVRAGASGRFLHLGYFSKQLSGLFPFPGHLIEKTVNFLHICWIPIRFNFGDLITVYAKKVRTTKPHA